MGKKSGLTKRNNQINSLIWNCLCFENSEPRNNYVDRTWFFVFKVPDFRLYLFYVSTV